VSLNYEQKKVFSAIHERKQLAAKKADRQTDGQAD
jgi:hypothetical protein